MNQELVKNNRGMQWMLYLPFLFQNTIYSIL